MHSFAHCPLIIPSVRPEPVEGRKPLTEKGSETESSGWYTLEKRTDFRVTNCRKERNIFVTARPETPAMEPGFTWDQAIAEAG